MKRNLKNISMIDLYEDRSIADAILYESIRDLQNFEATVEFQSCDIGELDPRFIELLKKIGVDVTKLFSDIPNKVKNAASNVKDRVVNRADSAIEDRTGISPGDAIETGREVFDALSGAGSTPTSALEEDASDDGLDLEGMVDRSKNEAGFREGWAKAMKISCDGDDFEPGDPMAMDFINQTAKDAFVQVAMPLAQLSMMPMGSICKFIISLNNKFVELLDTAAASYCKGRTKTSKQKQDEIDNSTDRKRFITNLNSSHSEEDLFFNEPPDDDAVKNYDSVFGNLNAMGYGKTNLMAINFFHILYPKLSNELKEKLTSSGSPTSGDVPDLDSIADATEEAPKVAAMKKSLLRKREYRDHLTPEELEDLFREKWPTYTRANYTSDTRNNSPTFEEYFRWKKEEFEEEVRKKVNANKTRKRDDEEAAKRTERDKEKSSADTEKLENDKKKVRRYSKQQELDIRSDLKIRSNSEFTAWKKDFKSKEGRVKSTFINTYKDEPDFPDELKSKGSFDRNIKDHPSYDLEYKKLYYRGLKDHIKSQKRKGKTFNGRTGRIDESFALDHSNSNRSLKFLYTDENTYVSQINEDIFFKNSLNNLSLNYLFEDADDSPTAARSKPDAKQIARYVSGLPRFKQEHQKVKSLLSSLDRYDSPSQITSIADLFKANIKANSTALNAIRNYLKAVKKDSGEFNNRKKEIESAIKAVTNELDRIGFK